MAKVFQVRYTVGDKTVAHEHYTEKGGRSDAKALSKVIGNAQMGEIDVDDEGAQSMVRTWEFTGGEMGKAIKREGPVSPVEVIKGVEETRLSEGKIEKKAKTPKLTDDEKIAKKKAEAEDVLKQIEAGTYVIPARGRKAGAPATTKPKSEGDRVAKLMEDLGCTEHAAKIISGAQLNATGRRTRVTLAVINAEGPILASDVVSQLNGTGKEDRAVDTGDVLGAIHHLNFLFSRENQPWRVTIRDQEGGDKKLNLVPVRIEIQGGDEDEENTSQSKDDEAAA
jgi:hypothetical protein